MNKLILWGISLFTNIIVAQSDQHFLSNFLLEDELKSGDQLNELRQHNFSSIWNDTANEYIYGIIGDDHERIRIKFLSINKNVENPNEYYVSGKSMVKDIICDFFGTITLQIVNEVKELHFGVDDEFRNKGIKKQGILIAEYYFEEDVQQKDSGVFKGKLYSKWYLDKNDEIKYDDIQSISDSYCNNAYTFRNMD